MTSDEALAKLQAESNYLQEVDIVVAEVHRLREQRELATAAHDAAELRIVELRAKVERIADYVTDDDQWTTTDGPPLLYVRRRKLQSLLKDEP